MGGQAGQVREAGLPPGKKILCIAPPMGGYVAEDEFGVFDEHAFHRNVGIRASSVSTQRSSSCPSLQIGIIESGLCDTETRASSLEVELRARPKT